MQPKGHVWGRIKVFNDRRTEMCFCLSVIPEAWRTLLTVWLLFRHNYSLGNQFWWWGSTQFVSGWLRCHPLAKPAGSEQGQSLLCVTVTVQLNASTTLMEHSIISIPFACPVEFIPDQVGFLKVRVGLTWGEV